MEQQDIREYNNQRYSKAEGAALIKELDDRTKSPDNGYNSIAELGSKVQSIESSVYNIGFYGAKEYQTKAAADAVTPFPSEGTRMVVTNDPTPSNNGYYSSVSGVWVASADLHENTVDESNIVKGVTGKAVFDYLEPIKSNTFKNTSVIIIKETFAQDNYLTNTGSSGGQPGYVINKYPIIAGKRYKINGTMNAINTNFGIFGFYAALTIGSYVSGIVDAEAGVNNYDVIVTAPAGANYLFVTQETATDVVEIREELAIESLITYENTPNNLHSNYQLETAIGKSQTNGNTATPLFHIIGLDNTTNTGYQVSDCPTGFPAMTFNMGTSGAAASYMLTGIEIKDADILAKIKGKSVTLSYYIKHDAALTGTYLNRVQGAVTDVDYTDKTQNSLIGQWYKIEHEFTVTSDDISQLILRSYPNAAAGVNVNIELSSFSLKLTEDIAVDYLFSKNSRWEALRNSIINASVELSLSEDIYIVHGERLELFKHSISKAINPDNFFLKAEVVSGTPQGFFLDRVYRYDAQVGHTPFDLKLTLTNNGLDVLDEKTITINPVAKKTNPASTYNVLLLGDSFTQYGVYPAEFARRLQGTGGTPSADNLSNVNFIGTAQTSPNREGASGQSWEYFIGASSPFWNGSAIDFDDYCTANSYSQIDAVVIMLGTNSTSTNADIQVLLDALVAHNPSIKGVVSGILFPTPFGGTGSVGIAANQTYYSQLGNILSYNRRLEALIKSDYDSEFVFCDALAHFDIINNMKYLQVGANVRNQATLVKQGIDNVHPADVGYLTLADVIYSYFHYKAL